MFANDFRRCRPSDTFVRAALRPQALLDTVLHPEAAGSASDGGSPLKIALFSLGNMCAHRECREALQAVGFTEAIDRLASSNDTTVQKYVTRIKTKLAQAQKSA
jgi:hypothetical protein